MITLSIAEQTEKLIADLTALKSKVTSMDISLLHVTKDIAPKTAERYLNGDVRVIATGECIYEFLSNCVNNREVA